MKCVKFKSGEKEEFLNDKFEENVVPRLIEESESKEKNICLMIDIHNVL